MQTTCFSRLEVVFMFHPVPLSVYYLQAAASAEHIIELTVSAFLKHMLLTKPERTFLCAACPVSAVPSESPQLEQRKGEHLPLPPRGRAGASLQEREQQAYLTCTAFKTGMQQQR